MNYITLERAIRNRALRLFTPLDLERLLGVSRVSAQFLVHRYAKRGGLVKLRNALYALADQPLPDFAVANRLYEPSYVSFETALAHYHLIPESAYAVTSATPRPTRTLTATGKAFEYHRIKREAFTGYEPVILLGETVLIAAPEKALVDYLYFVDLKKKSLNDRLALRAIAWPKAEAYARLFARPSLLALLHRLR